MNQRFSPADLEAYMDEELSVSEASHLEDQLRKNPDLVRRLAAIHGRRDAGVHSLGEIWRRHRISCPDRETLGSYLLAVLDAEQHEHVRFHIEYVQCRYCQANLDDLRRRQGKTDDSSDQQRQRYFQSGAGYLRQEPT